MNTLISMFAQTDGALTFYIYVLLNACAILTNFLGYLFERNAVLVFLYSVVVCRLNCNYHMINDRGRMHENYRSVTFLKKRVSSFFKRSVAVDIASSL